MNKNKLIQLLIFSIALTQPSKTFSAPKTNLILISCLASCATIWGYIERTQKNNINLALETNKKETAKIQDELEKHKSEQYELEKDQNFLSSILTSINNLDSKFKTELDILSSGSVQTHLLVDAIKNRMVKEQIKEIENYYLKTHQELNNYGSQLTMKTLSWTTKKNYGKLLAESLKLANKLTKLCNNFEILTNVSKEQKNFLNLSHLLEKNLEQKYLYELKLNRENALNITSLDKYIRGKCCGDKCQFPYLTYTEHVKFDLNQITSALSAIDQKSILPYQEESITKSKNIIFSLETILGIVASSNAYIAENKERPEFERQEKIVAAELNEKRAKIDHDRRMAEIKLQEEKNKESRLSNEQAEIARSRKQLEIKEREMTLEWARIRDGETIKDALTKNNREWQQYYDKLSVEFNNLKSQKADVDKKLEKLSQDIQAANTKIKNNGAIEAQLKLDAEKLKSKMDRIIDSLGQLQSAINPSFNPDMVDGFREYLNNLQARFRNLQIILANQ